MHPFYDVPGGESLTSDRISDRTSCSNDGVFCQGFLKQIFTNTLQCFFFYRNQLTDFLCDRNILQVFAHLLKMLLMEKFAQTASGGVVFWRKSILKTRSKFTWEQPSRILAWLFSCKFVAYFKNTFSKNTYGEQLPNSFFPSRHTTSFQRL